MTRGSALLALAVGPAVLALALARPAPVLADGGPHVVTANSGTAGLAGDCAACHRAHTAQASDLLRDAVPGMCLVCHDGTGATTDVVDGLQYAPDGSGDPTSTILGALRGGGFAYALIDSGHPARLISSGRYLGKIGVRGVAAKQAVTSTHAGNGTVWGNGPDGTAGPGAGPVGLSCISCHNPHGNGQYRILAVLPGEDWASEGVPAWHAPADRVEVRDIANPTNAIRNYTVLPGAFASSVLGAGYTPTQGDYWRLRSPWNLNTGSRDQMEVGWDGVSPTNAAANGGTPPSNATGLMTAWCVACHSRYSGLVNADGDSSSVAAQADAIFTYRHLTMNYGCEQCHVSHGSNALMLSDAELWLTDPDGTVPPTVAGAGEPGATVNSGDSRLLKADGRATCQLCHDPTGTAGNGYTGPTPMPGVP